MQNTGNQRERLFGKSSRDKSQAPCSTLLSMYDAPPSDEISIDEFEEFAIDRLHVLKVIETHRIRNSNSEDTDLAIKKVLHTRLPLSDSPDLEARDKIENQQRKDQISHFILRLSYCQNEDLRRWFLSQETALFRYRLEKLTASQKQDFLVKNGLHYEEFTEYDRLKDKLDAVSRMSTKSTASPSIYYKVPFTEALELVATRQVYLEGGYAFVPVNRLVSLIVARFRMKLSRAIAAASKSLAMIRGDERLSPLIQNLSKQYIGPDYTVSSSTKGITPDQLDQLAEVSMPLCMRSLHHSLRSTHKLKHMGRLQYGLFLKGAGLSLENAIAFWQQEFTKIMSIEQFTKEYLYNIRYNYGKEGKRTDYTPYNCQKIIMGPAPTKDALHGCPYRHCSKDQLQTLLGRMSLSTTDRAMILDRVDKKNYQLACLKHFESTHPGAEIDKVGNHPNGWFEASRDYWAAKSAVAAAPQAP